MTLWNRRGGTWERQELRRMRVDPKASVIGVVFISRVKMANLFIFIVLCQLI